MCNEMSTKAKYAIPKKQENISNSAGQCLHAFQNCLHSAAALHPRELSLVENQLARFSIWTSSIGVFSQGRASMDHRLREAPDVHDAVTGLLEALFDNIENCSDNLKNIAESRQKNSQPTSSVTVTDGTLAFSFEAIAKEISLLYKISNTIRRASKEAQNLKAAKSYRMKDDEGHDVEQLLHQIFSSYLVGRFPSIKGNLCDRLASSMLLRRRRILYRRSRYGNSPIKPTGTISQPQVELPQIQNPNAIVREGLHKPAETIQSTNTTRTGSIVQSVAVTATTLFAESYKKASTPSVISATKTIALDNHEQLVFPPPPDGLVWQRYKPLRRQREKEYRDCLKSILTPSQYEEYLSQNLSGLMLITADHEASNITTTQHSQTLLETEKRFKDSLELDWNDCIKSVAEVMCPFCFYALPSWFASDKKKWRDHVMSDLDAYVCLFDDCDKPDELYNHSSDWLAHMRKHILRWRCNSKSHGKIIFPTEKEYLDHMKGVHASSFNGPQLSVLAERHARPIGPMFEFCPICGTDNVTGRLEDHIVRHLRYLALRSLPPYVNEGSESSASDKGSNASKPMSRSTIQKDPDKYTELTFQDVGDTPTWKSLNRVPMESVYQPWGGYKNYMNLLVSGGDSSSFLPPAILADSDEDGFLWHKDHSRNFAELSLFDGISIKDRRRFEWGFLTESVDKQLGTMDNDPIIQSILRHNSTRLQAEIPPTGVIAQTDDNLKAPIWARSSSAIRARSAEELESLGQNSNTNGPIMLIGDSVGIAPFRGFLNRRLRNFGNSNHIWVLQNPGDSLMDEIDNIQWGIPKEQLESLIQNPAISNAPVDELVLTQADLVWYIINAIDGCIFACSQSFGAKAIEKALTDVAITQGNLEDGLAQAFWQLKAETGQYVFENGPWPEPVLPSITRAGETHNAIQNDTIPDGSDTNSIEYEDDKMENFGLNQTQYDGSLFGRTEDEEVTFDDIGTGSNGFNEAQPDEAGLGATVPDDSQSIKHLSDKSDFESDVQPDRSTWSTPEIYHCCQCDKENQFCYDNDPTQIDCPECLHRREDDCCAKVQAQPDKARLGATIPDDSQSIKDLSDKSDCESDVQPNKSIWSTLKTYHCCQCDMENHFVCDNDPTQIYCPDCGHIKEDDCCAEVG